MLRKKIIILCVFFSGSIGAFAAEKELPENYLKAAEYFENEEYNNAKKLFKKVLKDDISNELSFKTRIYIIRCYRLTKNIEKALKDLDDIIDEGLGNIGNNIAERTDEIIKELDEFKETQVIDRLEKISRESKIPEIRKTALKKIGEFAEKGRIDNIETHINFMIDSLRMEREIEVAKTISQTIYKLGEVNSRKLIRMYKKADTFYKKKLLYLISKYDDEDLIMALQEEAERTKSSILHYISWALAKMDPYRFAALYRGKLKKDGDRYILHTENAKIELFKPSLKRIKIDALEVFVTKRIIVYGVEIDNGIIFTEVFESD